MAVPGGGGGVQVVELWPWQDKPSTRLARTGEAFNCGTGRLGLRIRILLLRSKEKSGITISLLFSIKQLNYLKTKRNIIKSFNFEC